MLEVKEQIQWNESKFDVSMEIPKELIVNKENSNIDEFKYNIFSKAKNSLLLVLDTLIAEGELIVIDSMIHKMFKYAYNNCKEDNSIVITVSSIPPSIYVRESLFRFNKI